MKNTAAALLSIDTESDHGFGPNPVAIVTCPHCGARLEAIDAKMHVRTVEPCEGYNVAGAWVDCDRLDVHDHGILADAGILPA